MHLEDIPQIDRLSTQEKMQLLEELWDDISQDEQDIPVPESHKAELLERYRRYKANPDQLLSLEELKERIAKWK